MEDREIVELFFRRSERAIAELDTKYGRLCRGLAQKILNDPRDVEECMNDAYLGAWNAIPPAKPERLGAYICRIVRNLSIKRFDKNRAAKRFSSYDAALQELEECIPSGEDVAVEVEAKELTRAVEAFMDTLDKENRVIFLRRYWFSDTYAEIGSRVGLSEKNVSVRLARIRKQLKEFLTEGGYLDER